jgi:uncharacterized membrane protein
LIPLWILIALLAAGCGKAQLDTESGVTKAEIAPETTPTFTEIHDTILTVSCFPCHNAQNHKSDVDMTSYASLMANPKKVVVVPGNAAGSKLYVAITKAAGSEGVMPPKKHLTDAQIGEIGAWIAAGALND